MRNLEAPQSILSQFPEDSGVVTFPGYGEVAPQGPLNDLAEVRSDFPNLEILPRMGCKTVLMPPSGIIELDIPDMTQFICIQSTANAIASLEGRSSMNAVGVPIDGVFILNSNAKMLYCGNKHQVSILELSGTATNYVSLMFYISDKMVNL